MTKTEEFALKRIYMTLQREGEEFGSFKAFLKFADRTGYKTRLALWKLNQTKKHGPDNSYWYLKNSDLPNVKSPFCEQCDKKHCPGEGIGCAEYREWFVKYWNEYIHRKVQMPKKTCREVFCYEHPDLQREGIVWTE